MMQPAPQMELQKCESPGRERCLEGGVPNGIINLLTPHLERLILPFSGEIRMAA